MAKKKFSFPANNLVNDTLLTNKEFVKLAKYGNKNPQPLVAFDENGNQLLLELWTDYLTLCGLSKWSKIKFITNDAEIQIEVDNKDKKFSPNLSITLKSGEESLQSGLYLGKYHRAIGKERENEGEEYFLDIERMRTHAFVCGMTGSGKTFLTKAIIEEMLKNEVPVVAIDLKGDLASLGIIPIALKPEELAEFCADSDDEKNLSIARAIDEQRNAKINLSKYGITQEDVFKYRDSITVQIITPKANYGHPISLANQLSSPPNADELRAQDPDLFASTCAAVTDAFLDRLFPHTKRGYYENERAFMHELISWCWKSKIELKGEAGLRKLEDYITDPPFEEIGGLSIAEFLDKGGRRSRLLQKIANQLAEPEKQWNQGEPLTAEMLVNKKNGKTPLSIISVSHLTTFEDRAFVVAQISYILTSWMLTQSESNKPRVMLVIDEIGAQGGTTSLFPSYPKEPPSKRFLSQIIRQGRSFGVCSLLATQNPSDIDYKALGNCGIWMVGSLTTNRDRINVMQGMGLGDVRKDLILGWIAGADTGKFVVRDVKKKSPVMLQARWLYSYHKGLDHKQLVKVKELWDTK